MSSKPDDLAERARAAWKRYKNNELTHAQLVEVIQEAEAEIEKGEVKKAKAEEGKQGNDKFWPERVMEVARCLWEARDMIGQGILMANHVGLNPSEKFSLWLKENKVGIPPHERAAYVGFGKNPNIAVPILQKIGRKDLKRIWLKEVKPLTLQTDEDDEAGAGKAKKEPRKFITLTQWQALNADTQAAALVIKNEEHLEETTLNEQDNASIEWAKYSWNPVTGCKHNCPYCYARDIANRFYKGYGFEPTLHPARLGGPFRQKLPKGVEEDPSKKNIFTCSMADLFGRWVPDEWIDTVMQVAQDSPDWNFLFLTKFAKRMVDRKVPKNAWLGTSVDLQVRVPVAEAAFAEVPARTRWLSLEPLIEPLVFKRPETFQWVVIGGASASSKTPAWQPPFEWVARLYLTFHEAGVPVYVKDNIGWDGPTRPKEFPWTKQKQRKPADVFQYLGGKRG